MAACQAFAVQPHRRRAKNYLALRFKFDYVKSDGNLSNHTPDFIVKGDDGKV